MVEMESETLQHFLKRLMTLRLLPIINIGSNFQNKDNLNEKQIMTLIMIDRAENQALVSTIADELFLDRPQVSRLVDTLEDLGFVTRKITSRKKSKNVDRRKIRIEVTDTGSEFLSQFYEDRHLFFIEIIKTFGLNDIKKFSSYIERFNTHISERIISVSDDKKEKKS
jgi:DNA-binding MarR family transcriptional regulator